MTDWQRKEVGEICERIVDCINKTAPTVDADTPYKMIRTPNVRDGFVRLDDVRYVTEETYDEWTRRVTPRPGDVILTREAPLGAVGMVRTSEPIFLGQRLVLYRADPEKLDNRFLLYALMSHETQGQIEGLGSGATVPHMRVPDCERVEIPVPPLSVQKKIGSVLSNYDELIENNRSRISVLEEMAEKIYQKWFVNYNFPGHENIEMVDSEIGEVPNGWNISPFSDVVEIRPRERPDKEEVKPHVPMGSISEDSMVIGPINERDGNRGAKFRNNDTLFARITPSLENGKTGFVRFLGSDETVGLGSGELIPFRSIELCPELVYLIARDETFRQNAIQSMTGASGRQRVQTECFDDYLVAVPPREILDDFQNIVSPIFDLVFTLYNQNNKLKKTRDILLPRLISNDLSLSDRNMIEQPIK